MEINGEPVELFYEKNNSIMNPLLNPLAYIE